MGPSIDPCGTLLETSPQLDRLPITISLYIWLDNQFLIHLFLFLFGTNLFSCSLWHNIWQL